MRKIAVPSHRIRTNQHWIAFPVIAILSIKNPKSFILFTLVSPSAAESTLREVSRTP